MGRKREVGEIKQRFGGSRLLTLTGAGGVGKTRLALRAASELARAFPDGVWLVPLASIEDAPLVTQAVFHALGLQDRSAGWSLSALTDHLATKHLLLVLDNCEHLLDSCAVLTTTLLQACPELRVLATSRQALGIAGESRLRVPSLSLPEDGRSIGVDRLLSFEAVALLAERARAVVPGFRVDASNAPGVLSLCRRLDGIPLALELAAARLEALSLDQLNQALDRELAVLGEGNRGAEPRQQTLEATIAWSYRLLTEPERRLWAELSVFAGGFEEDAAIDVCSGPELPVGRLIELLAKLVEKSILKRDSAAQPTRYMLLETLRQYGRQKLRELGTEIRVQRRHRDWILTLAKLVGAGDSRQAEMFNRLNRERDNLWAALEFCLQQPGEASAAAEMAQHLMAYWTNRGPYGDVRRMLMSLVELTPRESRPRARLLWVAASMALSQMDIDACAALTTESLRIGTELNDGEVVAWSYVLAALPPQIRGDLAAAAESAQSAISLARLEHLAMAEMAGVTTLQSISLATGDLDRVIEIGEQAVALSRECGELWQRGYLLNYMSQANWLLGDRQRAESLALEGAACKQALDDRQGVAILLETLAWMAAERGAHQRAAVLLGSAEGVRAANGLALFGNHQSQHDESVATAVQGLGQGAFNVAHARGLAMTIDEGVAFAVEEKPLAKAAHPVKKESGPLLTRREREIAALISQGLSNKQIAARLVVSERTADSHVLNILNKLGFNSRTQIANWVATSETLTSIKT